MNELLKKIAPFSVCLASILLCGCGQQRIEGTVYNVQDEELPGVAVMVGGNGHQGTTDALGRYAVPYETSAVTLHFNKSGYTPGRLDVAAAKGGTVQAAPVRLWRLPGQHGVYVYEDHRYLSAKPAQRETFNQAEGAVVYGSSSYEPDHPGALVTGNPHPRILCYRMPEKGVQLHRLELRELMVGDEEDAVSVKAFVASRAIPVSQVKVDEPEGVLRQVKLVSPLEPGTYAVHWGALGPEPEDPRLFVFTVAAPADEEGPDAPEDAPGDDGAAEPDEQD